MIVLLAKRSMVFLRFSERSGTPRRGLKEPGYGDWFLVCPPTLSALAREGLPEAPRWLGVVWRGGQGVKGTLRHSQSWVDGAVPRALQLASGARGVGITCQKPVNNGGLS